MVLAQQKGLFRPACSLPLQAATAGRRSSAEEEFRKCITVKIRCPATVVAARAGGTRFILRHLSTKSFQHQYKACTALSQGRREVSHRPSWGTRGLSRFSPHHTGSPSPRAEASCSQP